MAPVKPALVAIVLAAACGDPLVDGGYWGVPLLQVRGPFGGASGEDAGGTGTARFGVFWNPGGARDYATFDELVEQPANGVDTIGAANVVWAMYEAPGAPHLTTTPGGAQVGIGVPLGYMDTDDDNTRDGNDVVFAMAERVFVYADRDVPAEDSPTGHPISAGFHLASLPLDCEAPAPRGDAACGVKLGAPCRADADCGSGGTCLDDEGPGWLGGYCAIADGATACRPADGVYLRELRAGDLSGWWVKACARNADCGRQHPYHCDVARGACLGTANMPMTGRRRAVPTAICRAP